MDDPDKISVIHEGGKLLEVKHGQKKVLNARGRYNQALRRSSRFEFLKNLSSWEALRVRSSKFYDPSRMEEYHMRRYQQRARRRHALPVFQKPDIRDLRKPELTIDDRYWFEDKQYTKEAHQDLKTSMNELVRSGKGLSSVELNIMIFHTLGIQGFLNDCMLQMVAVDSFYAGILLCSMSFAHESVQNSKQITASIERKIELVLSKLLLRHRLDKANGDRIDLCLEPFVCPKIPGHLHKHRPWGPLKADEFFVVWRFGGGNALCAMANLLRRLTNPSMFSPLIPWRKIGEAKLLDAMSQFFFLKNQLNADSNGGLQKQMMYLSLMEKSNCLAYSKVDLWYDVQKLLKDLQLTEKKLKRLLRFNIK